MHANHFVNSTGAMVGSWEKLFRHAGLGVLPVGIAGMPFRLPWWVIAILVLGDRMSPEQRAKLKAFLKGRRQRHRR